jgi:hypothetical protein
MVNQPGYEGDYLHPMLRLRMCGAIPSLFHTSENWAQCDRTATQGIKKIF